VQHNNENPTTIFIGVIAHNFPLETPVIPMGIEQLPQQSFYTPSAFQIVLFCVHAPRGLFRVPFLPHPLPLSDGNLYPAALVGMRGNYFRPYLSILACAIEVQHNNENPTTFNLTVRADLLHSQREIVSTLKKLTFSISSGTQLPVRALDLIPCLIPSHRCENLQENLAKLTISIRQRDNIHAKATDMCVDPRGYMASGWRNLF